MATFFESTIPLITYKLGRLRHIVITGQEHAADHDLEPSALTAFRLYPDMLPFTAQINIPTDIACGCTARLTGNERLSLDDSASTFEELVARIDQVIAHFEAQDPKDYEGAESRQVTLKVPGRELTFSGEEYVPNFVMPNLYFHMTTAYLILRHNGVRLGKLDYM